MRRAYKKRVLSIFMTAVMCLSLLPTTAFAEESSPEYNNEPPAVSEQGDIQEISAEDSAVTAAQALIDALPTIDTVTAADYDAVQDAYDVYLELTEEQQAKISGTAAFEELFGWFNEQTAVVAENIAKIDTSTGYTPTTYYTTWDEIKNWIENYNGNKEIQIIITLLDDVTVNQDTSISNNVKIKPDGHTVTCSGNGKLSVGSGAVVTIDGNSSKTFNVPIEIGNDSDVKLYNIKTDKEIKFNGTDGEIGSGTKLSLSNCTLSNTATDSTWTVWNTSNPPTLAAGTYYMYAKVGETDTSAPATTNAKQFSVSEPVASVTVDGTTTQYSIFTFALHDAQNAEAGKDVTLTLQKDCSPSTVTINRSMTLDLNGKKLTATNGFCISGNSVVVTIQNGEATNLDADLYVYDGAKVKIAGGTFKKLYVGQNPSGTTSTGSAELSGGTFGAVSNSNGSVLNLLADGYSYQLTDKTWHQSDSAISTSVTVKPTPVKSVSVSPTTTTLTYGYATTETLTATADAAGGSYQWYKVENETKTPIDGATESTYAVPTGLSVGTHQFTCAVTKDGFVQWGDVASVTVNRKKSSGGGKVAISIPYTPKVGENTDNLEVWFIRDDGTIEKLGGYYDAENKCFVFETGHLSRFLLVRVEEGKEEKVIFTDVPEGVYYAEAVNWAAKNGITGGVTVTTFAPNAPCTRGQIVSFLWRAAGCLEPTNHANPFNDVSTDAYYYKAVLWAVENGIAKGTSETTFSPDAPCTRAQAVSFIYRNAQANGDGFTGTWMFHLPFVDVPEWCYEAVAWCYMNDITGGTSETTFSPEDICTRAQIVAFLYRAK